MTRHGAEDIVLYEVVQNEIDNHHGCKPSKRLSGSHFVVLKVQVIGTTAIDHI